MQHLEHAPWKAVLFGAGASILLFALVFFFIAPGNLEYFTTGIPEKAVKFKKVWITGKTEGKISYKLYAEEGWANKDASLTVLKNVGPGSIYRNGTPTIKWLRARYVKIYRFSKEVEAFNQDPDQPKAPPLLSVRIDLGKFSEVQKEKPSFTAVSSQHLRYFERQERSSLDGRVTIREKNSTITTPCLEIDHKNKDASFPQGLVLYRKNLTLEGSGAFFSSKEEKMVVKGPVFLSIKNKNGKGTRVECSGLTLYTDPQKELLATGGIRVIQPKKIAFGEEASYNQDQKTVRLKNKVEVIIEKFADILKEETLKNIDDPETQKTIREKTVLQSDWLTIFTDSEDALAEKNVTVTQKGKEAKAEVGKYTDKTDQIILTGNVHVKKEKEWVKAQRVVVSVKDESFEALGAVESEFKIKK